jgi:hypothetical protein
MFQNIKSFIKIDCLILLKKMELKSKEGESEHSPIIKRVKDWKPGEEVESELTEKGDIKFKKKKNVTKGRTSRAGGARFELKVREDLKSKKWIVDKWSNNVDLEVGEVVIAKRKFNPFSRVMTIGTGFPDFIAFQLLDNRRYNVIGVEVKMNGLLSKTEKEKCAFLLREKVFNEVWIAKKKKEGRKVLVEYVDFKEKYGEKFKLK